MEGLNRFCKDVNTHVREKGFWDSKDEILDCLATTTNDYLIKPAHDAIVALKIVLIVTELSEAVEGMRKPGYEANGYGFGQKDSFADKLADTFIRLADLCGELGIDIEGQIEWKMNFNRSRGQKHGKEF